MGFKRRWGGHLVQQMMSCCTGWEKDLIREEGPDPEHPQPSGDGLRHHLRGKKMQVKHKGGQQLPPELSTDLALWGNHVP